MSVKAKIIIDEKEINVLSFSFGFNQKADTNGRPTQKPVFLGLNLIIETRKDLNLADWAFAPNQTKQIELHIYPVILGGKTRKLYFYDCHLVNWENDFSSTGSNPMSETLKITAAGLKNSNSLEEYSAYWRTTFPQQEVESTVIENNKKVSKFYLTNTNNEKINNYKIGETIRLCLETQNRIGDKVTINLNDPAYDFEHNGNLLKGDIIKDYIIGDNIEQIELKIIKQKTKN